MKLDTRQHVLALESVLLLVDVPEIGSFISWFDYVFNFF